VRWCALALLPLLVCDQGTLVGVGAEHINSG